MEFRPSWLAADRRPELLVAGTFAAIGVGLTAVGASFVVAVATLAGALGPGAGLGLLLVLLVVTVAAGLGTAAGAAGLAWTAVGRLRSAAGRSRRRLLWSAYRRARAFEERTPIGRLLRPARLFEGRDDRDADGPLLTELKTRYVAGELDELTFERELARLLGGEDPTRRVVEVTAPDGGEPGDGDDAREEGGGGDHVEGSGGVGDEEDGDARAADRERASERA